MCGRPSIQAEPIRHESGVENCLLDMELSTSKLSLNSTNSIISFEDFSPESIVRRYVQSLFEAEFDLEYKYFIGPLEANLPTFYEIKICVSAKESTDICMRTILQNSEEWKDERSMRITASNAYSLFTYYTTEMEKSKNWKRKISKLIFPDDLKTVAIEHGRRCEQKAIKSYEVMTGTNVERCGFVVPPQIPWIGCSPDGIIIQTRRIIEIKFPLAGKTCTIQEILLNLSYLTKSNQLRKRHMYYAQIQINMFVLQCNKADFVIYSEFEDKCHIIPIDFDEDYVYGLLNTLKEVYFNVYLKYLYTLKN
nr:uncharacterized protein LOC115257701 [Aedes albopictus]